MLEDTFGCECTLGSWALTSVGPPLTYNYTHPNAMCNNLTCINTRYKGSKASRRGEETSGKMYTNPPPPQGMSYYENVNKRHQENGCLYA